MPAGCSREQHAAGGPAELRMDRDGSRRGDILSLHGAHGDRPRGRSPCRSCGRDVSWARMSRCEVVSRGNVAAREIGMDDPASVRVLLACKPVVRLAGEADHADLDARRGRDVIETMVVSCPARRSSFVADLVQTLLVRRGGLVLFAVIGSLALVAPRAVRLGT